MEFNDDVHFFSFWPEIPFWTKFHTRLIWICRIMKKICGVYLFCFRPEKPFLGKSVQKNQNCQFELKFGTKTNLNKRYSMVMFTFSVFLPGIPFWANLIQKIKIVSLSWNFVLDWFEYVELCRKYVVFTFFVLDQKNHF